MILYCNLYFVFRKYFFFNKLFLKFETFIYMYMYRYIALYMYEPNSYLNEAESEWQRSTL